MKADDGTLKVREFGTEIGKDVGHPSSRECPNVGGDPLSRFAVPRVSAVNGAGK